MKYSFYGWQTATITDSNGLTPRNYYDLLSGIWCVDTCAPRMDTEEQDARSVLYHSFSRTRYLRREGLRRAAGRWKLPLL